MRFLKYPETLDLEVSSIHKDCSFFWWLKIRFFKGHENVDCKIYGFRREPVRHFGRLKKRLLTCRYIHLLRQLVAWETLLDILATRIIIASEQRYLAFVHFEGLKMRFLWSPETLGSRLCEYRWAILDI